MVNKIIPIEGNSFKIDGGSMFGHVPKTLWSRWIEADGLNRVTVACRCLLAQDGDKNILIDAGTGTFLDPILKERYDVDEEHVLLTSLAQHNLKHEDIDIVILSHLHFDHCGGVLSSWSENKKLELLFPNAKFIVSKKQWQRATKPHALDHASFIPELHQLLEQSGRLILAEKPKTKELGENFYLHFSDGHTPGLISTEIATPEGPVIFISDLVPGADWVHLPVTTSFDRAPEQLVDEKAALLQHVVNNNIRLCYVHDNYTVFSYVTKDDEGRYDAEY
ncbi:MAG: MBL fold metallo-hydrolase [Gammaproteobacteria bacterium]|nr:MBL fold metallo-hydrolase [Gammaproteobacteria bacterium]